MKKGDIVTINDGSYSRSVVNGKLIHEFLSDSTGIGNQYIVVETACKFPNKDRYCQTTGNNTVIQVLNKETHQPLGRGKVVFLEERFLRLVQTSVREVTMAEVCKQFGEDVKIKKG